MLQFLRLRWCTMLMRMLNEIIRRPRPAPREAALDDPATRLYALRDIHQRAPLDLHLRILFEDARLGGRPLKDVLSEAEALSGSVAPPLKAIRRRAATVYLVRYFEYARTLQGAWAECGVFRGLSALCLCIAARARDPSFDGSGLHLVDSFAGLSAPDERDRFEARDPGGVATSRPPVMPAGNFVAQLDEVSAALRGFPGARLHQGWIPQAFAQLPECSWSFVHVDVDLHAPTLETMRYFYPRLVRGGVMICDDYVSEMFPGAQRAWDAYCREVDVPFVALPTGQSVLVKP